MNLEEQNVSKKQDVVFYYSKFIIRLEILVCFFFVIIIPALIFIFIPAMFSIQLVITLTLPCIFYFFQRDLFRRIIDNEPQLKITEEGVWTKQYGLYLWENILETKVYMDYSFANYKKLYLSFSLTNGGTSKVVVNDLDNTRDIQQLINLYSKKIKMSDIIQEKKREHKSIIILSIIILVIIIIGFSNLDTISNFMSHYLPK